MHRLLRHVLALAALSTGLFGVSSGRAASLQKINQSEWGVSGLPSYVNMYLYVPDRLAAKPPVVVAPHHCQGTGPRTYGEMSSLVTIANSRRREGVDEPPGAQGSSDGNRRSEEWDDAPVLEEFLWLHHNRPMLDESKGR